MDNSSTRLHVITKTRLELENYPNYEDYRCVLSSDIVTATFGIVSDWEISWNKTDKDFKLLHTILDDIQAKLTGSIQYIPHTSKKGTRISHLSTKVEEVLSIENFSLDPYPDDGGILLYATCRVRVKPSAETDTSLLAYLRNQQKIKENELKTYERLRKKYG